MNNSMHLSEAVPKVPCADSDERSLFNGDELFTLCLNLFTEFPLLDKCRRYLETLAPKRAQFLIMSDGNYIHPENPDTLSTELVMSTVAHSDSGIFCRNLDRGKLAGERGALICSTRLGKSRQGKDIVATLLFSAGCDHNARHEDYAYSLLAVLRDFYGDLAGSRAVRQLMDETGSFRFIINTETKNLISRRLPAGYSPADEDLAEAVYNEITHGQLDEGSETVIDNRIKNFKMTKFRLRGFEYLLLSFEISPNPQREETSGQNQLIQCFAHRIKNKLASLQTAASQLALHPGNAVDSDDMALLDIIQTETEFIDRMINRMSEFTEIGQPRRRRIDLVRLITDIVEQKRTDNEKCPPIMVTYGTDEIEFPGDTEQLEAAIDELLDNAIDSGRNITIDIEKSDQIHITIQNMPSPEQLRLLDNATVDITEPFVSCRYDKVGLGLSIAERIITLHDGEIEAGYDTEKGFVARILLPDRVNMEK